jgi:hypothetical protein
MKETRQRESKVGALVISSVFKYAVCRNGWVAEKAYQEESTTDTTSGSMIFIIGWKESPRFIASGKAGVQTTP